MSPCKKPPSKTIKIVSVGKSLVRTVGDILVGWHLGRDDTRPMTK